VISSGHVVDSGHDLFVAFSSRGCERIFRISEFDIVVISSFYSERPGFNLGGITNFFVVYPRR
jgi:hypothetical protein